MKTLKSFTAKDIERIETTPLDQLNQRELLWICKQRNMTNYAGKSAEVLRGLITANRSLRGS